MSSKPLDTKERTAARLEKNAQRLDNIRLYNLTELEPIIGVTHQTLLLYMEIFIC